MIDTEAIRSRILDHAMRGQLSEQSSENGTAKDLFQWICSEKQALIKAGTIKKEKPLPELSVEEIPFAIPDSWQWVRLKSICTKIVDGDHNPPSGVAETTGYLMLSAQNINHGKICDLDKVRYLTEEVFIEENKRTNLQVNDVLLTIVGTIGRSCVYEGGYNICFQRSVSVITTLIIPKYLKYALDMTFIQRFMEANATGAAQLGFYLNKLEKLPIPLPPLIEQQRIVERIDQLFSVLDTIDALQAQYADNLTVLKAKLIDAAIQGKLTEQLPEDGTAEELFQQILIEEQELIRAGKFKKKKTMPEISEEEKKFEIPNNWKWVRLGDLISIESGMGLTTAEMISGDVPVYGGNGITGYHNKSFVPKGTVVVGRVGYYCGSVHITNTDSWVTDNAFITTYPEHSLDRDYLVQVLRQMKLGKNNNGSAQPVVSGKKIYPLLFPLPPLAEQRRIAAKLEEVLSIFEG